jgi:Asp-tRNA(Asn)/Glu-tRNA(Gln) amidotransferase A subunit family amidase
MSPSPAKDIFDVAGVVTGCGNPDWAATHAAAAEDAWAPLGLSLIAGPGKDTMLLALAKTLTMETKAR